MCGKNPATTYVGTIVNGELTEYAPYGECAQKMGYGNFLYPSALDFDSLLGSFLRNPVPEMTNIVRYPGCDSSFGETARSGKARCAECYNTSRDRMMPSIQRIRDNIKHLSKRPNNQALQVKPEIKLSMAPQEDMELSRKGKELREAVENRDFKRAAMLRDEIEALEGGSKA